jgi:hypothetical protein
VRKAEASSRGSIGISGGAVAGTVMACLAAAACCSSALAWLFIRRRRDQKQDEEKPETENTKVGTRIPERC